MTHREKAREGTSVGADVLQKVRAVDELVRANVAHKLAVATLRLRVDDLNRNGERCTRVSPGGAVYLSETGDKKKSGKRHEDKRYENKR
jgi:hypothetical protein